MSSKITDLPRVVCMMDDVLGHGSSAEEHNQQLTTVLKTLQKVRVHLSVSFPSVL